MATPCLRSRTLSDITGAELWLKFENLQYTASFKERGALNRLAQLTPEQAAAGVIAMSAGNHAQGVAYHARRLGIPATIVMPRHTPFVKVENTRRFGARVLLEGEGVEEAALHAWEIAARDGLTFVHPFDDAAVIAGQGTLALEMLEAAPGLEVLVVPIGGGGLIGGMATAAKAVNPRIEIVGVEAALYPSVYRRLRGLPALAGGPTIAEGIAVKEPGNLTYPIIERLVSEVLLVEEAAIEAAVLQLLEIEKTVAEGAGAAGLAAVMSHPDRFRGRRVGLVLCGGNIDSRLLSAVILRGLVRTQRLVRLRVGVPDSPGQPGQDRHDHRRARRQRGRRRPPARLLQALGQARRRRLHHREPHGRARGRDRGGLAGGRFPGRPHRRRQQCRNLARIFSYYYLSRTHQAGGVI